MARWWETRCRSAVPVADPEEEAWSLVWCLRKGVSSQNLFQAFATIETIEATLEGRLAVTR